MDCECRSTVVTVEGDVAFSDVGDVHSQSIQAEAGAALLQGQSKTSVIATGAGEATILLSILRPPPRILVLGAGLDAQPVVRLASELGWRVTVQDHRPAYIESGDFAAAEVVHCLPGYWSPEALQQDVVGARSIGGVHGGEIRFVGVRLACVVFIASEIVFAVGESRCAEAVPLLLERLHRRKVNDLSWAVLRVVRTTRDMDAIPKLISMLGTPDKELRREIGAILRELTGENIRAQYVAWKQWHRRTSGDSSGRPEPRSVESPRTIERR